MNEDVSIKEKILQAATELLKNDAENITVRNIAAKAGVTQGLINYHFQSKDNLVNIAAQRFFDENFLRAPDSRGEILGDSVEILRVGLKNTLKFLCEYPGLSRASILKDMQTGSKSDNTHSLTVSFNKLLRQILQDENQRFLAVHIFVSSIQALFMRSDVLLETHGFDISSPIQRNKFADDLIETVLKGLLV
ncbi:MAG: TetR/AcrR family transcriptional regulator [Clostridiales bacterium]|jgi:AcrR family transcriptional regulator|nr:TetR/AcrR family transcriptional regulator [Clostridiales bacterium]